MATPYAAAQPAAFGPPPPAAGPAPPPREPHSLSLKVLRAARPSLVQTNLLPYYEPASLGGSALAKLDAGSIERPGDFPLSGALSLPSTFGTIYLGETFSALLCLSHDLSTAPSALTPVLKVEMHCGSAPPNITKHHLKTIHAPTASGALASGESAEGLVQHEVKELGMHALVCTVTYGVRAPAAQPPAQRAPGTTPPSTILSRSFRKVYKFQVSNPLSVRTKAYAPSSPSLSASQVFLEVQIHNHSPHSLVFEKVKLDPVPLFTATPIPARGEQEPLTAGAVRQLLFLLDEAPSDSPSAKPPPGSSQPLGRLDLAWRTPYGELARLQTSMLGRKVPDPPSSSPFLITPSPSPPSFVKLQIPFSHTFTLSPLPAPASPISVEALPSPLLAAYGKARVRVNEEGTFRLSWIPIRLGLSEIRLQVVSGDGGDAVVVDSGMRVWVS